jgi:hypothetical protein
VTEQQRMQDKQWSRIIAKAWADDTFRDRLLSEPKAALREQGFETSRDVCVREAETGEMQSTDEILYLVLPPKPDISEEELLPVGVAYCYSGGCFRCGRCGCGCGRCGGCGACGLCRAV